MGKTILSKKRQRVREDELPFLLLGSNETAFLFYLVLVELLASPDSLAELISPILSAEFAFRAKFYGELPKDCPMKRGNCRFLPPQEIIICSSEIIECLPVSRFPATGESYCFSSG